MIRKTWMCLAVMAMLAAPVSAAFIFEVDTDGADDSTITYNPNFSFGGDTTVASQSAPSRAFGTSGADSIFGGNGINDLDTYSYTYSPSIDADNLVIPAGTDLGLEPGVADATDWGSNDRATGLTGGQPGLYNVYATWPVTMNVSGGPTRYSVNTPGDSFVVDVDQNLPGNPAPFTSTVVSHGWYKLGQINWSSGAIVVRQMPTGGNTFVSQRSYGLLFEPVPEPASLSLFGIGLLSLLGLRRR